jgi:O-antigen/teichoic acid export membrane protein
MSVWSPARNRIVINLAALLAGRGLALGINLLWLVATVRLFAPPEVAVLAFASLAATWLEALKGLGAGTWMVRQLANQWSSRPEYAARMVRTFLYCTAGPLVAGGVLTWLGAAAARPDLVAPSGSMRAWTLALLGMILQSFSGSFLVILQCFGDMKRLAVWNTWFSLTQRLAPVSVAFAAGWGLEPFLLLTLALSAASLLPALHPVRQWLSKGPGTVEWREFWLDARHFYASSLLRYGATQLDQVLVAFFFSAEMLVTYYVLRRFYSLAVVFISSCVDAVVPILTARAADSPESARGLLSDARALIVLAGTFGAALTAANGAGLLEALLGGTYARQPGLVVLFSLAALAYGLYSMTVTGESVLGSAAASTRWVVVALVANIISVPVLAGMMGVYALPLALAIGFVAGTMAASWGSALDLRLGSRIWIRFLVVLGCGAASSVLVATAWPSPLQVVGWNGLILVWLAWEYRTGGFRPLTHWFAARRLA